MEREILVKEHNTGTDSISVATGTAQEFSLCLIAQGETDTTREGAGVLLKSISFRWIAQGSITPTGGGGAFRIMVFIDNDPRQSLPAATDYLTTQHLLSGYNTGLVVGQERNRGRFHFIYDETFNMPTDAIASADQLAPALSGKFFRRLNNVEVRYVDDSASLIEQNQLVFAIISQANTEVITFLSNAVVRFTSQD